VDPKAKAAAAAKAVAKGTSKKKTLKKRFSVTFHRCAPGGVRGKGLGHQAAHDGLPHDAGRRR
jgi:hypothetical protein